MTSRLRILVGLGISALIIGVLLWEIDPGRVAAVLAQSRWQLLPLALVPFGVDLTLRTIRWHVLLAREPRPGYRMTFAYLVIGYLANNILPARLGELVRAHLLGTREGVGRSRALGSIAMERGLDVVAAALLGAVACTIVAVHGGFVAAFSLIALAAGTVIALVVVVPHDTTRRIADRVVARMPAGPFASAAGVLRRFLDALLDAAAPGRVLAGLGLSLAAWTASSGVTAVAAGAVGVSLPPMAIVAAVVSANLGAALPSAPAGIGPYEFGMVVIATALGVDPAAAFALGIVSHVCTVVPVSILGGYELGRVHWGFGSLRQLARAVPSGEADPA